MIKSKVILISMIVILTFFDYDNLIAQDASSIAGGSVEDFLGFEMVYVPSGTFQMGIDEGTFRNLLIDGIFADLGNLDSIDLVRTTGIFETYELTIYGFWIDKYEISINQYENLALLCHEDNSCSDSELPQELTWQDAVTFCANRNARLPTEEEWEYAASGSENSIFPWGNELDASLLENHAYTEATLYPVGSKAENVSWSGIYDLAGNSAEWTNDLYQPYYPWTETSLQDWYQAVPEFWRVMRGGSSENGIMEKTTYSRQGGFHGIAGFRCVRLSDPRQN